MKYLASWESTHPAAQHQLQCLWVVQRVAQIVPPSIRSAELLDLHSFKANILSSSQSWQIKQSVCEGKLQIPLNWLRFH